MSTREHLDVLEKGKHMKPVLPVAMLLIVSLSGCAQVTSGLNSTRDWLADPKTASAVETLKAGASAFVCAFSSQVNLAAQIESAVNAGQALQRDTHTALTVSTDVCVALGGKATGTAIVPAS